ncbi:hypothetical protein EBB07_28770 [Paenibacillaceae bacterium]|nr:hypothetical protein EBB07_28770 [Paenibacillaceae bacterium]
MLAEVILGMIEEYREKIQQLEESLDDNNERTNFYLSHQTEISCYEEFTEKLELLLNTEQ